MESTRKTRVLVVNREPLTRFGVTAFIRTLTGHEICGEAANAPEARQICAEQQPDLIIIDLPLPGSDSLGLLRDFSRLHRGARMLVITSHEDINSVQRAFQAGAHGYLQRSDDLEEVRTALDRVGRGERFASRHVSMALLDGYILGNQARSGDASMLSDTELGVFERIGKGLGPTVISRELGVSVKTVETHQMRIKAKLKLKTAAELQQRAKRWAMTYGVWKDHSIASQLALVAGFGLFAF